MDSDNKKRLARQAQIAFNINHPELKDIRDAAGPTDPVDFKSDKIQWNDLFAPIEIPNGSITKKVYLADCPGFWDNFGKLLKDVDPASLASGTSIGERLDPTQKAPYEFAQAHNSIDKLLEAELWQGREEQLKRFWFRLPSHIQKDLSVKILAGTGMEGNLAAYEKLTSDVYALSGQKTIFESLKEKNIELSEIMGDVRNGKITDVLTILTGAGFDADDCKFLIIGPTPDGSTNFDGSDAWKDGNFVNVIENFIGFGATFKATDFLNSYKKDASVFSMAQKHNNMQSNHSELNQLFSPHLWIDNVDEMLELVKRVEDHHKKFVDLNKCVADAVMMTFAQGVQIDENLTKESLLKEHKVQVGEETLSMRMLGLEEVWDRIEDVQQILADKQEALGLEDLRLTGDGRGNSFLHLAARAGKFEMVMDMLDLAGDTLTADDLLKKNLDEISVLDELLDQDQLDSLLYAEHWMDSPADLDKIYSALPDEAKDKIDMEAIQGDIAVLQVQNKALEAKQVSVVKIGAEGPKAGVVKSRNRSISMRIK